MKEQKLLYNFVRYEMNQEKLPYLNVMAMISKFVQNDSFRESYATSISAPPIERTRLGPKPR